MRFIDDFLVSIIWICITIGFVEATILGGLTLISIAMEMGLL